MSLISLAEWRNRKKPKDRMQYFCTNCESDQFRLSASGVITCAACDRRMSNLVVTMLPKETA